MKRRLFVAAAVICAALSPAVASAQTGMGPQVTPEIVAAAVAAKTPTAPGPVKPTWESIGQHYKVPPWFIDAKFGITMHWGLYSVAAYHNEWYKKHMYASYTDWHAKNFGPHDQFGYKDFIPLFTAKDFDADDVALLVKESGAKYFMPTVEHHDTFSLWDSKNNPFNAKAMGPRRDLVGEMAVATRKQGLKFGVASHNFENFTFVNPKPGLKSDVNDPKWANFYWQDRTPARTQEFLEGWVLKSMELIDQYQPDIIWFDNGVNAREYDPLKTKVAAYYYNRARQWGKDVTFDTKSTAFLAGSVLNFEKLNPRGPTDILKGIWEAEEPLGNTWGYSAANPVTTYRNANSVVDQLAEIASRNGNLLLNLSPEGQGRISEPQRTALKGVGQWLKVNGEAIYGTHNWVVDGEGFTRLPPRGAQMRTQAAAAAAGLEQGAGANPALTAAAVPVAAKAVIYRFTVKGDALYAIAQTWPADGVAVITSLAPGKVGVDGKVARVSLLGHAGDLKFTQDAEGLKITLPAAAPTDYAHAFKIEGLKMNAAGPIEPAIMADLR